MNHEQDTGPGPTHARAAGPTVQDVVSGLAAPASSTRLRAALAAGTRPEPALVGPLVRRCAVEPDFQVREMLTWALTRHDADLTVAPLVDELASATPQARSQALHTLSKIGDVRAWPAVTAALLRDPDDEVARAAWRAAVVLAPPEHRERLAALLVAQLGRGSRDVRLSLSRALVGLGGAATAALDRAVEQGDEEARAHAAATRRLVADPDEAFDAALAEARRVVALAAAPTGGGAAGADR
jgi:HEAT repeat protein